jgi:hypothetical protein
MRPMRPLLRHCLPLLLLTAACSNASSDDAATGGASGEDAQVGGTGGIPVGGTPTGGTGGAPAGGSGGAPVGGTPTGGTGGQATGGEAQGGAVAPWDDETDTPWTPTPPADLRNDLPAVPAPKPAECTAEYVTSVRGYITAPGGRPLVGAKGQVCVHLFPSESLLCLRPGDSDERGIFTVEMPENARCITKAVLRVLQPGVGKASTYCPVEIAGTEPNLVIDAPLVVFQTRRVADLPPEGDELTSRAITFDDGLVVDFTPDLYYSGGGEYADLGGRRVDPTAPGLCFFGEADAPEGLYALYPEGQITAPGFPVHIPNATGLPAGAAVQLYVLGGLDCKLADGSAIPEASWQVFGTGTVSADGSTIDSDAGVGLPCLTWLGYRRLN